VVVGSDSGYRTSTIDEEDFAEILASLKQRRAAAAEGGDGSLVAVLDEVIAELEAGNLPASLRPDE
jgi:hypothetical protein